MIMKIDHSNQQFKQRSNLKFVAKIAGLSNQVGPDHRNNDFIDKDGPSKPSGDLKLVPAL